MSLVGRIKQARRSGRSLARFLAVGVSNTLISYFSFLLALTALEGHRWRGAVAQAIGYSLGILWSFVWNRYWSFESKGCLAREMTLFIISQMVCLLLSVGLIGIAVDVLEVNVTLSWVVVMGAVTLLNFGLLKIVVFGRTGDN
jgi:putative flippase GtrA